LIFSSYNFLLFYLPATWLGFVLLRFLCRALLLGRPAGVSVTQVEHHAIETSAGQPQVEITLGEARRASFANACLLLWLLLASLWFYADWRLDHLWLLLGFVAVNFGVVRLLTRKRSVWLLIAIILANVGLLAFFKYIPLFTAEESRSLLLAGLPLGISFYVFQAVAFQIDHWRGKAVARSPLEFALFLSFFPQLIAGPIVHGRELLPQLRRIVRRNLHLSLGLTMLALGLAKKVLIADSLAGGVDSIYAGDYAVDVLVTAAAGVGYGAQLYFDFSGYADMAVGLGLLFGIKLPQNFRRPYTASSVTVFWRRWHITLSRFLRDYLYISLGGNRRGNLRRSFNLLATMGLGGLWHGAGWQFLFWGLGHGFLLTLESVLRRRFPMAVNAIPRPVAVGLTLIAVMLLWIPFRAESLSDAWLLLSGLVILPALTFPELSQWLQPLVMAAAVSTPPAVVLLWSFGCILVAGLRPTAWRWALSANPFKRGVVTALLLLLVLKTLADRPAAPFLYFQF